MESNQGNPIRYVCLSDLHLGEEHSILNLRKGNEFEESEVMEKLAECLKSLFEDKKSGKIKEPRPTLILNGDIMELALGRVELSAMMFERFMKLIMSNRKEIFDRTIIFVPGNHDHHIWETAREAQYENYILRKNLKILPAPWHRTGMVWDQNVQDQNPVSSTFLATLLKRHTVMHDKLFSTKLKIQVSYPNLAIPSDDHKRCTIIHHGHFTEGPYCLMSHLNTTLTDAKFPDNIDTLERENFAWIDFLWSTLGRSGSPGSTVENIYEYIKNPHLIDQFIDKISRNVAKKCDRTWLPGTWGEEFALRRFFQQCIPAAIDLLGERNRRDIDSDGDDLINQDVKKRLNQFLKLSWPLLKNDLPKCISDMSLIYGHTHKPFSRIVELDRLEMGINKSFAVYNTGGWVVDQTEIDKKFGASIVLMDHNLNTVSLQVYREGELKSVLIDSTDKNTEFYNYIDEKIKETQDCWNELAESATNVYKIQVELLKKHLTPNQSGYSPGHPGMPPDRLDLALSRPRQWPP